MSWNSDDHHTAAVGAAITAVSLLLQLDEAGIAVSPCFRESVVEWKASRAALDAHCKEIEARRSAAETYHPALAEEAE